MILAAILVAISIPFSRSRSALLATIDLTMSTSLPNRVRHFGTTKFLTVVRRIFAGSNIVAVLLVIIRIAEDLVIHITSF